MQFAVVNSSRLDDGDVAFMVAACDIQLQECAGYWGVDYAPVAFYLKGTPLPATDIYAVEILDDLDAPGALGYHDVSLGFPYAKVEAQGPATSVTLSHELLETLCDRYCTDWRPRGDGMGIALEVGDPVEADQYGIPAAVTGETRAVDVSNYILPAWFGGTAGPYDRMHRLTAPWTMTEGGYMLTRNARGDVSNVFAKAGPPRAAALVRRLRNPRSRLMRRLANT